uniref:TSC22 domain family protein 3 n=1 Tax=Salmo trutta TaxID=8032 RepID=A0A674A367_SALTR
MVNNRTVKASLSLHYPLIRLLVVGMGACRSHPHVVPLPSQARSRPPLPHPGPAQQTIQRLAEPPAAIPAPLQTQRRLSSVARAMNYHYQPPYSPSLSQRGYRRASGASVVAIDNKIEQAMDLVKNHLMYAVREEVEILKEQIRELAEKNNQLERENSLLKNLASPEQMESFRERVPSDSDALVPLQLDYQQQAQIGLHNPDQSCHISAGSAV